ELPEVHALAADLESRLGGRVIERLEIIAFAALKTYDPPVTALSGTVVSTGRNTANSSTSPLTSFTSLFILPAQAGYGGGIILRSARLAAERPRARLGRSSMTAPESTSPKPVPRKACRYRWSGIRWTFPESLASDPIRSMRASPLRPFARSSGRAGGPRLRE